MNAPLERSEPTDIADEFAEVDRSPSTTATLKHLVRRELSTAFRPRDYLVLWVGLVGVFFAISWFGGGFEVGYVSTIIDLSTPLELLIPVLAFAFGYRTILDDERRGVLDVLRTYPLPSWQIVVGVYLGRAIGLVVVVSTALSFLFFPISVTETYRPLFYATHTGADSPGLFLRFIVLTALFALVALAVAIAISALVSSARSAIVVVGLSLFALLFVADIALVFGLSRGFIAEGSLVNSLAISPLSAYRGLVLETTVAVTAGTGPRVATPVSSLLGLAGWWLGSLLLAAGALGR